MSVEILDLAALALTAVFFALLYYLHKKKHVDFGVRTILAVGLGLIVGLAFKGHHVYVAAVGTVYAHVVSAVVIPLLVFSIISSITNLGNSVRLKNIGLKTVFFLVLNTFFASLITLVAGVATNIGHGVQYELATDYTAKEVPTFVDTVISLFPQNLASHWANGEVVPIVVFSILVAISYNKLVVKKPEEVAPFKKFIDAGDLVMGRVVSYVISFTPYAVLSLIARAVSRSSPADLIPLLSVLVLAYILCAIQLFVVEGALVKLVGKLDPVRFFKGIWPAATVAFTSQMSPPLAQVWAQTSVCRAAPASGPPCWRSSPSICWALNTPRCSTLSLSCWLWSSPSAPSVCPARPPSPPRPSLPPPVCRWKPSSCFPPFPASLIWRVPPPTSSALRPLPPLWPPPKVSWMRLCTMARPKCLPLRQSEHFPNIAVCVFNAQATSANCISQSGRFDRHYF